MGEKKENNRKRRKRKYVRPHQSEGDLILDNAPKDLILNIHLSYFIFLF